MGKNYKNFNKEENTTDEIMEAPVETVAEAPVEEAEAPVEVKEEIKVEPKKAEVAKPVSKSFKKTATL